MALKVERGKSVPLEVMAKSGGQLIDVPDLVVDILDSNGAQLLTNIVPTHVSLGRYRYDYLVATDAILGVWTAHWTGSHNNFSIDGDELFEVVLPGTLTFDPEDDAGYLRLLLDDPDEDPNYKTFLTESQLGQLLSRWGSNIYGAAADGWSMKAAYYARRMDHTSEGNTTKPYSQLYRNAVRLAEHYMKMAANPTFSSDLAVAAARVVGRAISLREDPVTYEVLELVEPEA